jgi:hypothetical protein
VRHRCAHDGGIGRSRIVRERRYRHAPSACGHIGAIAIFAYHSCIVQVMRIIGGCPFNLAGDFTPSCGYIYG